jgi:hypothetical protein
MRHVVAFAIIVATGSGMTGATERPLARRLDGGSMVRDTAVAAARAAEATILALRDMTGAPKQRVIRYVVKMGSNATAPISRDEAVDSLARGEGPMQCVGKYVGEVLTIDCGSLPLDVVNALEETIVRPFAKELLEEWAEGDLQAVFLLRGREEELLMSAAAVIHWRRNYHGPWWWGVDAPDSATAARGIRRVFRLFPVGPVHVEIRK